MSSDLMWVGKFTTTIWRAALRCCSVVLLVGLAQTVMFGSVGEGLEAVIISPGVKEKGSCPGPGDPDPFWDPDYLPEFCRGGHFLN